MDDWPSHTQELSRKTAQTLDRYVTAHANGKISLRETYLIVTALYDATSGLIDKSLMNIIADIQADLRRQF